MVHLLSRLGLSMDPVASTLPAVFVCWDTPPWVGRGPPCAGVTPSSCLSFPLNSQPLLLPDMDFNKRQLILQLVAWGTLQ